MEIIITSLITFITTNIDDIFILTLFYGDKKYKNSEILSGQLLGIVVLIAISLMASLIGLLISKSIIGLLGLFPVYLGIKGIWRIFNKSKGENETEEIVSGKSAVATIAGITMANGGDNVGIYVPMFATLSWMEKSLMILIFLLMTVVWCVVAKYLVRHPYIAGVVEKYGHIVTPFVLIVLGIFILQESGTLEMILMK